MLELEQALTQLLETVPPPTPEDVTLAEAVGRVLLSSIAAPLDLPPFDNSSMDGYAVRAEDLAKAGAETPVCLRLIDRIPAGEAAVTQVLSGSTIRIFTGSPLPPGADAVVMQEDTRTDPAAPGQVLFSEPVRPWENVRFHGEDIRRGAVLAESGSRVTPARLCLFAASGLTQLSVGRQPRVAVLATGSELKEAGGSLRPGQIFESNRVAVAALAVKVGAKVQTSPLVSDSLEATREALLASFNVSDVVLTSGGVSVGEFDFVRPAFESIGGKLEFWKVAIRPGKPFVFGRLGKKLLLGLPGNPVSAFVTFLLLVRPVLLRWQGASKVGLPSHPAKLLEALSNPGDRRHFVRARLDSKGGVSLAGVQASHVLSSLAAANALIDVPPLSTLAAGSEVQVLRWEME